MPPKQDITIVGLGQARRDLKRIDAALPRELSRSMKTSIDRATLPTAREQAPHRTGRLAASLKPFSRGTRAGVRSTLPYANAVHWGWPGRNIQPNRFLLRASARTRDEALNIIGDNLDDLFRRHGFND